MSVERSVLRPTHHLIVHRRLVVRRLVVAVWIARGGSVHEAFERVVLESRRALAVLVEQSMHHLVLLWGRGYEEWCSHFQSHNGDRNKTSCHRRDPHSKHQQSHRYRHH